MESLLLTLMVGKIKLYGQIKETFLCNAQDESKIFICLIIIATMVPQAIQPICQLVIGILLHSLGNQEVLCIGCTNHSASEIG